MIGSCMIPAEAMSGFHVPFLPMIFCAWLIGVAMGAAVDSSRGNTASQPSAWR
jgi:hypothetical protein